MKKWPQPPKIGLRIVKSAAATFICFVIYLLRGQQGVPFYSAIAAILCMQPYVSNSVKTALNRTIGTLIGGFCGMLVLLFERSFIPHDWPLLQYLLVSVMILPLIYITVVIKKPMASYITCVVFLSVTISHGADVNPYLFTMNRILDTLIGIFVSLGVNMIHLPQKRDRDLLMVTALDNTLVQADGKISPFAEIWLNRMLERGAKITMATSHTPAWFLPALSGVNLKLPVIAMNGAALYHTREMSYTDCIPISSDVYTEIAGLFRQEKKFCFVTAVYRDVLHVYFNEFTNAVQEEIFEATRTNPHISFLHSALPSGHDALTVMTVNPEEEDRALYEMLCRLPHAQKLNICHYQDPYHPGYMTLEVSSVHASKAKAMELLQQRYGIRRTAAFGGSMNDLSMLRAAFFSYAVADSPEELKKHAFCVLKEHQTDSVVKMMGKLFFGRKPKHRRFMEESPPE